MTVSLEDQIKCARRELAMRRNVYPKWVTQGRMQQETANRELAAMAEIVETLELLRVPVTHVHRGDGFLDRIDSLPVEEARQVIKRLCAELEVEREEHR